MTRISKAPRVATLACLPLLVGAGRPTVDVMAGTFTNEEQVYFDKEAGKVPPPWMAMTIHVEGNVITISEHDAFGAVKTPPRRLIRKREGRLTVLNYGTCQRFYRTSRQGLVAAGTRGRCNDVKAITAITDKAITLTTPDTPATELRRARRVTCWSAVRKNTKKPDGKDDWHFEKAVKLHDQGGRAVVGAGVPDLKPVILRMRSVTWPQGNSNRPSLVLYVHTPEDHDSAVSYAWSDPQAARLGINLRWMQASCTIEGAEKASEVTAKNFRG